MSYEVIALLVLILLSAFFSGSETALLSLSKLRLHHQVRQKKPKAALIQETLQKPDQYIAAILVGNNFVNIGAASLATGISIRFLGEERGIFVASIVMTLILLIFSETLPKTYAAFQSEKLAYQIIYPMRFCMKLFYPLTKTVTFISNSILSLFGVDSTKHHIKLSEEELKTLISVTQSTGALSKEKEELLQSIFELDKRRVKDILTPRNQMVMIEVHETPQKVIEIIEKTPFSRIPVFERTRDNILGILYTKDFLKHFCKTPQFEIRPLLKEASYVPELQNVRHLVRHFQKNRIHVALVVNEYGGLEGLVTLEDALEEIVGDIQDEFDVPATQIKEFEDGSCLVMATYKIEDLNQKFSWDIPEKQTTLGALISDEIDRIPSLGEVIKIGRYEMTIVSFFENSIGLVKVKKL
ncbi:MAG: DUF21 domain-containing protein [Deltaproteobacteria bacterium]|nr:DUF21 domain-containing protein [Deltaproteobacteria bacterium]